MNEYIAIILISMLSSFFAALVFASLIRLIRPKIRISEQIAKGKDLKGNTVYRIKVVNQTRRAVMGLKAYLYITTPVEIPAGTLKSTEQIPLVRSEVLELAKYKRETETEVFSFNFITQVDLDGLWDDSRSFLRFRLYVVDSLSGFGRLFIKDYHLRRTTIKEGSFEARGSLKIL